MLVIGMVHKCHSLVGLLVASIFVACMAPSGMMKACPQRGAFRSVSAQVSLCPVSEVYGAFGNWGLPPTTAGRATWLTTEGMCSHGN